MPIDACSSARTRSKPPHGNARLSVLQQPHATCDSGCTARRSFSGISRIGSDTSMSTSADNGNDVTKSPATAGSRTPIASLRFRLHQRNHPQHARNRHRLLPANRLVVQRAPQQRNHRHHIRRHPRKSARSITPARSAAPTSTARTSTRASSPPRRLPPGGVAVDASHVYWTNRDREHDRPRRPRRHERRPELRDRRRSSRRRRGRQRPRLLGGLGVRGTIRPRTSVRRRTKITTHPKTRWSRRRRRCR